YFLVPRWTELSTLELMSRPTYRLAELEIRPATDRLWHLDTYGIVGLRVYDLEERRYRDVQLPEGVFVSDLVWEPEGSRFAFLAHLPGRTEVWTADAATGRAGRLSDARVLATLGTEAQTDVQGSRMLQWTPQGTVLTLVVPADRGAEPARDPVPDGPLVRRTRPEPTPTRTFPYLLRDAHDARLFEHYTRAQLVELAPGRRPRPLGEPRMYQSISLSPDGEHVLATYLEKPFSFITSYRGFPSRTAVLERGGGSLVRVLEEQPLREGGGRGRNGGLRELAWRPAGSGLPYLRRDGDADEVMLLAAPFDTAAARAVASSEDGLREVSYSRDGSRAFATATREGRNALVAWDLREA